MVNQNCFGCGKLLDSGENKKRRRLLSSPSLSLHLKTLSSLAVAADSGVDTGSLNTGYICRSCVGLIEKYHQLHKQLSNNFSGAISHIPQLTTQSEAPEASTSTLCSQPGSHETETSHQLQSMELASTPLSTDTGSQTLQAEPSSPSQSLETLHAVPSGPSQSLETLHAERSGSYQSLETSNQSTSPTLTVCSVIIIDLFTKIKINL